MSIVYAPCSDTSGGSTPASTTIEEGEHNPNWEVGLIELFGVAVARGICEKETNLGKERCTPVLTDPCDSEYCGNGICRCGETASSCPADCYQDPCSGITCPDKCEDSNILLTNGYCQGGQCYYTTQNCQFGCQNAHCLSDPCASETCGNGVCNSACGETESNCPADCGDSCAGVTCPDDCYGDYRRYNGQCNPSTGECEYDSGLCAYGCENGHCLSNPCVSETCGNGVCRDDCGETPYTCPNDCAECLEGETQDCVVNGKKGTQECDYPVWGVCEEKGNAAPWIYGGLITVIVGSVGFIFRKIFGIF